MSNDQVQGMGESWCRGRVPIALWPSLGRRTGPQQRGLPRDVPLRFLPAIDRNPILGLEGLEYRLGGCCSPLPGEAIVGSVALGNHGITIHRQDCANVAQVPVERRLPVRWNPLADGARRRYPVQLRIAVLDRVGVLKDILTRLSDSRINVSDARVRTNPGKPARIDLRVELASASQLGTTMDQIRAMADVLDIARSGIG